MVTDPDNPNRVIIHDFSSTLYRWAYDYHNSVNDLIEKQPGLQMFAVKYNNACLAFELIIKSHIAYANHASSPKALDKIMRGFGHSIRSLADYATLNIGLVFNDEDEKVINLIDKYYTVHLFRYPPYEPRKSPIDHQELMNAINRLRDWTVVLLVVVHEQTDGYAIP